MPEQPERACPVFVPLEGRGTRDLSRVGEHAREVARATGGAASRRPVRMLVELFLEFAPR